MRRAVKESFRSYISGTIAHGQWQTTDGVTYATPAFTWSTATGTLAETGVPGEVAFTGGIRFTGHDGLLDTTLANPTLALDTADHAVLRLDVSGVTMDAAMAGDTTPETAAQVPFVDIDLSAATVTADGDRVPIEATDAPTAITAEGFAAFGNYEAGTAFDPISLRVAATCPPAESSATPTADAGAAGVETTVPLTTAGDEAGDAGATGWGVLAGALAGLAVVGAIVALVVRRRRAATATDAGATDPAGPTGAGADRGPEGDSDGAAGDRPSSGPRP